jgi:ubiquinone/menaquinone biosynthesis C-methylase UbiE
MIAQGLESYRTLKYVRCIAEQLPIRDRCVDLVTCGQAFHWFERPQAMPEFSRVLRGDGYLAAYWNDRIESKFTAVLEDLIAAFNPRFDRGYRKKDWVQRIEDTGTFRVIDQKDFPFTVAMTNDGWIGMVRSFGYVRAIEPSRLPEFERALARELAHHNPPECGYVAQCWLANRA